MSFISRILELAGIHQGPTIASASTAKNGGINRRTANRMVDPRGYFQKNKNKNFHGKGSFYEVLSKVETERSLYEFLDDRPRKPALPKWFVTYTLADDNHTKPREVMVWGTSKERAAEYFHDHFTQLVYGADYNEMPCDPETHDCYHIVKIVQDTYRPAQWNDDDE